MADLTSVRRRFVGFTLIELLVVISIVSLLIAVLLPSLAAARESARRSACSSNVRQMMLGAQIYADDFEGVYPFKGGGVASWAHVMSTRVLFRTNYMGGNNLVFYCPSADYEFNAENPQGNAAKADSYFGYFYFGGHGGDTRASFQPHGFTSGAFRGRYAVTMSKLHADTEGNAHERPLFMDAAGEGGTYVRQSAASRPAFPVNNHIVDDIRVSVFENVGFVDGHVEAIGNPVERDIRFVTARNGTVRF